MKFRRVVSLLAALSLVFTLPACGQDAESSAEGAASLSAAPAESEPDAPTPDALPGPFQLGYYKGSGINPYTCESTQNLTLAGLVYEPLFELDESFQALPCLAESVDTEVKRSVAPAPTDTKDSPDGESESHGDEPSGDSSSQKDSAPKTISVYTTNVTIHLREGVTFTDGAQLDADDVAYSLRKAAAKGSNYRSRLTGVSNIRAKGDHTVKLTLKGACADAAAVLDIPIVRENTGDALFPVGTGPYLPERNKSGLPVRLTANQNWWQIGRTIGEYVLDQNSSEDSSDPTMLVERTVALSVQEIPITVVGDSSELIFGFSGGAISTVSTDLTGAESLTYSGAYDVLDYPTTDLLYLGCNTASGPCRSQELRSALFRAVDRDLIATRMFAGHAQASALPVSPSSPLYDAELAQALDYRLSDARERCEKAGCEEELTLLVNQESGFKVDAAHEIARELEKAGLEVDVQALPWNQFRRAVGKGNYDLYLGEVLLDGSFDLSPLLGADGGLNDRHYQNDNLDKLLYAFSSAKPAKRSQALSAFGKELARQAPFIPLCFKNHSMLCKKGYLNTACPTQQNLFFHFWDWSFSPEALAAR